jgi:hypothetical protein
MDPKKVRAIVTMPCPKAQEEIRVFLGLTGFYRKHIDGYARIVTLLTDNSDRLCGIFGLMPTYELYWAKQKATSFQ